MPDFNLEAFAQQHHHHQQQQQQQQAHFEQATLGMDDSAFLSSAFDVLSKESAFGTLDQSKLQLAGQDLDFSAFMSSLQLSYAI